MAKILIIDDSQFARFRILQGLKNTGHDFLEAENGLVGYNKILSEQPDCALCDILMPEMSGIELIQKLKAENISLPVIIITADIQKSTRQKIIEAGGFAILNKPINFTELKNLIQKITAGEQS